MATRKLTSEQLAAITDLAKHWGKIVAKNAYGEDGPGLDVDFDQMEQIAAAATAGLAAGTLEQLAEQQTRHVPGEIPCPACQRPCPVERRPRALVARGAIRLKFTTMKHRLIIVLVIVAAILAAAAHGYILGYREATRECQTRQD